MSREHADPCERCEAILACVATGTDRNGYAPAIAEIMTATGIPSSSMVVYHVDALVERGHLRKAPGIARGTTITREGVKAARAAAAR